MSIYLPGWLPVRKPPIKTKTAAFSLTLAAALHISAFMFIAYNVNQPTALQNAQQPVISSAFSMLLVSPATVEMEQQERVEIPPLPELPLARPVIVVNKPVQKKKPRPQTKKKVAKSAAVAPASKQHLSGSARQYSPDAGPAGNTLQQIAGQAADGQRSSYLAKVRREVERNKLYPRKAKKMKIQGMAAVEVSINAQGDIVSARLTESSGDTSLDQAALLAVKNAKSSGPPPAGFGDTIMIKMDFNLTG